MAHNLTVGEFPSNEHDIAFQDQEGMFIAKTETIQPGQTDTIDISPNQSGRFPYWCDVSGHREAGMVGTMIVV